MASAFCSRLARSHGVSPRGTATEATHWLPHEYPDRVAELLVEHLDG